MADQILPGAAIGVLGSGQLGRMMAMAAGRLGYRVHTFSPEPDSPTGQVAERGVVAPYEDLAAVRRFARAVDVVTLEFENVPVQTAAAASEVVPVHPDPDVLAVAQHRLREKGWLRAHGLPVAAFHAVANAAQLRTALGQIGSPALLKSAGFGYDGKGQVAIDDPGQAEDAWSAVAGYASGAVLEARVAFTHELSVVVARSAGNRTVASHDPFENTHVNGILDVSSCPAELPVATLARARELATEVAYALDVTGVLCVELFLTGDGELLVNEIAPRTHNSGHLTIEGAVTSQFEQQVRAVCGLPLGATDVRQPAAMVNLLGDLWSQGTPRWSLALATPGVALHLYGKREPRPGRKMGHLTALAGTSAAARELALNARDRLRPS